MDNIRYHEEQLTPVCIAVYRDCYDSAAAAEKEGGAQYMKVLKRDIAAVVAGIELACEVIGEQVGHEVVLPAPWNRTSTGEKQTSK